MSMKCVYECLHTLNIHSLQEDSWILISQDFAESNRNSAKSCTKH